jgi:hypothetical protein
VSVLLSSVAATALLYLSLRLIAALLGAVALLDRLAV